MENVQTYMDILNVLLWKSISFPDFLVFRIIVRLKCFTSLNNFQY